MSYFGNFGKVLSESNSTTTPIATGGIWSGEEWMDCLQFESIVVAVATDQDGKYTVQFSTDGVNVDSELTRYYRTENIEPPHRYTVTRRYAKVVFENTSATDQTYIRLQTMLGTIMGLNIPIDAVMSQDYDSISVRPTDFHTEVALGRREGYELWNKFGNNQDVDAAAPEVVASWGGTFTPLTTATTLTIVSTSSADTNGGTGTNKIVVYGIDANRDIQIEVINMNGLSNVVTTTTWLGINRVAQYLCGSGKINAGTINITATTGGSTMAQIPVGVGVTKQCIFHVPRNHIFDMKWLRINVLNRAKDATLTVRLWVYSAISNGKQEVYKVDIDTTKTNDISEDPQLSFPITEQTVCWLECTTDKNDIIINGRFSGELIREVDA